VGEAVERQLALRIERHCDRKEAYRFIGRPVFRERARQVAVDPKVVGVGPLLGGTAKPDWPILTNIRLDPFERTGLAGSLNYYNFFAHEFWRFTFVQQEVGKVAATFVEFPPMQKGASFNLEAVKEPVLKAAQAHHSQ
jgi:hypothetical protein